MNDKYILSTSNYMTTKTLQKIDQKQKTCIKQKNIFMSKIIKSNVLIAVGKKKKIFRQ